MEPIYIIKNISESIMGDELIIFYYTTENNGVGIDMYTTLKNGRIIRERNISENLFNNKIEAIHFVNKLKRGMVTPCTLQDIIDDIL